MDTPGTMFNRPPRRQGRQHPGPFVGILIIGLGVVFLLDNFGFHQARAFWKLWPLILIAIGFSKLRDCEASVGRVWGSTLIVIGGLLILTNFHLIEFNIWTLWPLALIFFGASMIYRTIEQQRVREEVPPSASGPEPDLGDRIKNSIQDVVRGHAHGQSSWSPPPSPAFLNEFVVFGGVQRRVNVPDFRGGEVLAVFGGFQLDLTKAGLAGNRAVIAANAMFGGVEIRVPENWNVTIQGTGVFGGFEDKSYHAKLDGTQPANELIVKGLALFGGVEVKN